MGYKLDGWNAVIAASDWYFHLTDKISETALVLRLGVKLIRSTIIWKSEICSGWFLWKISAVVLLYTKSQKHRWYISLQSVAWDPDMNLHPIQGVFPARDRPWALYEYYKQVSEAERQEDQEDKHGFMVYGICWCA